MSNASQPSRRGRRFAVAALITGAVVIAGGAAFATSGHACGEGRSAWRARAIDAVALDLAPGHLDPAALAQRLKLTPAQQPAWNAYAATLNAPPQAAVPPGRAAWTEGPAPQRLQQALERSQARQQQASARLAAMKTLYEQLDAEQRTVFDAARPSSHGHRFGRDAGHAPSSASAA